MRMRVVWCDVVWWGYECVWPTTHMDRSNVSPTLFDESSLSLSVSIYLSHHLQYHCVRCSEIQSEPTRPCGHQQDANIIIAC